MGPLKRRSPLANLDAVTLLSRDEVASRLGIGLWTLNAWIKSGRFPRADVRVSESTHRWRLSTVLAWVDAKAREPHRAPKLRGKAARWHQPEPKLERVRLKNLDPPADVPAEEAD